MSKTLSDEHIRRIKELFRQILGRDLSPAEEKYLGFSSVVVPINDLELIDPNQQTKLTLVNEVNEDQTLKERFAGPSRNSN